MHLEQLHPNLFLLHQALPAERCQSLIERAEATGFELAPVTTAFGPRMIPQVRDNTRVMEDDPTLASELFELFSPHFPAHWLELEGGATCVGFNERLRYYRYTSGQRFKMHRDGRFERANKEVSKLTVLAYLNEDFRGGSTRVITSAGEFDIVPSRGSVLCFKHELRHEGTPIVEGTKYVLRTDAMYKP